MLIFKQSASVEKKKKQQNVEGKDLFATKYVEKPQTVENIIAKKFVMRVFANLVKKLHQELSIAHVVGKKSSHFQEKKDEIVQIKFQFVKEFVKNFFPVLDISANQNATMMIVLNVKNKLSSHVFVVKIRDKYLAII